MIKLLFVVLVLSTIAVVGVAGVIYWRVRKHLSATTAVPAEVAVGSSRESEQSTSRRV